MSETIMERQQRKEEIVEKVREQFPNTSFPSPILEPIHYGRFGEHTIVKNRKLVLDAETEEQYDIVSDRYQLLYHEEMVDELLNNIPDEFGKPNFHIKFFQNGARMNIQATFPEVRTKINGSKIDPMIRLRNSYNRTKQSVFEFGAYELVCTNGLIAFKSQSKYSAKHVLKSLNDLHLDMLIKTALEDFSVQKGIWKDWAKRELTKTITIPIIQELPFSEKETETLMALPLLNRTDKATVLTLMNSGNLTLWDLNSAATQMAANEIQSESRAVDLQGSISQVMHSVYTHLQ